MTHRDEIHAPTIDLVVQALTEARTLVEAGHCKGTAHTVDENGIDCWCVMGATAAVSHTVVLSAWTEPDIDGNEINRRAIVPGAQIFNAAVDALRLALAPRWAGRVIEFNDASSQDAAVNLFSRAIDIMRAKVGVRQ